MLLFFILIYVFINIYFFVKYFNKENGVFTPPFVLSYVSIFIFLPQLTSIYYAEHYDNSMLPMLLYVMISCNVFLVVGFKLKIKKKEYKSLIEFDIFRLRYFNLFLACLGFLTVFIWNGQYTQTEDNVIPVLLKTFGRISFAITLVYLLKGFRTRLIYITLFLSAVPLFNYAFFLKGSRSEVLFLLFTIMMFLGFYFKNKQKLIKYTTIIVLVLGVISSSEIHELRTSYFGADEQDISVFDKFSYVEAYKESFFQKDFPNGMDLGNGMVGIDYCYSQGEYDYGLQMWNFFVTDFVPRRIVGEDLKNSLFYHVDYEQVHRSLTNGVTTMTSYFDAYAAFSVLAFLMFFGIGMLYGVFWRRAAYSDLFLFMILYMTPTLISCMTHSVKYLLLSMVQLLFVAILVWPFKIFYFKKIV